MKFVWYNLIPILLIILAGYLIYLNRDGWGWCVFGAICCTVYPSGQVTKTSDTKDNEDV